MLGCGEECLTINELERNTSVFPQPPCSGTIEALRVFAPVAFETISSNPEQFIETVLTQARGRAQDQEKAFHQGWVERLSTNKEPTERLVKLLFPGISSKRDGSRHVDGRAAEWRRELRVCSPDIFPVYFRLSIPEGEVSAALVRAAIADAGDPAAFGKRLMELAKGKRPDGHTKATSLLSRLLDHEADIPDDTAPVVLHALLDIGDDVMASGKLDTQFLEVPDEYRIIWLVKAMLRRTQIGERAAHLAQSIGSDRALYTITRFFFFLAGQHGKFGGKADAENERLLPAASLELLEGKLCGRLEAEAADGPRRSPKSSHRWSPQK